MLDARAAARTLEEAPTDTVARDLPQENAGWDVEL